MPLDLDLHSSIYSKHQTGYKTRLFLGTSSGNSSTAPPFLKHLMSIEELLLFRGLLEGCSEVRESPMLSARKYFLRCYFKGGILKGQFTKPGKVMDKVLKCLHILQLGVLWMGPWRKEPFISTKNYCSLNWWRDGALIIQHLAPAGTWYLYIT